MKEYKDRWWKSLVNDAITLGYKDNIKVFDGIQSLTGIGTEYLVKDGDVIAKFYNGNIIRETIKGNNEETITVG